MSVIGITSAFLGIIYAFVSTYKYFFYDVPFNGYTPIIILLLILGGLIMLMLGIIGEYLARIYDETRKKPIYIINEYID
jgi:dolichol-phosphate mannosyltransferase